MNRNALIEYVGRVPVVVLRGLAKGAWWSAYPSSAYWRLGGNAPEVEAALRRHAIKPGGVFWDLGAHFGIHAVGMARLLGPNGRVEAFEPDPVSRRRLDWHRRINRLPDLRIHAVAASERAGTARLCHYDDLGSTTSHLPYPGEPLDGVASCEVQTVALDDWVSSGRIRPPDFVKIDVEGHGHAALAGMRATLQTHRPGLIVGIHHEPEYRATLRLLEALGYTSEALGDSRQLRESFFGDLLCLPPARR